MVGKAVLIVSLALTLAEGCEGGPGGPGKDKGGDGNPWTGACKIEYSETVGGRFYRYPFFQRGALGERFIVGKIIITCQKAPKTHHVELRIQTRQLGAGQEWKTRVADTSNDIPNPKMTMLRQAHCDAGKTAFWRIWIHITGTGVTEHGPQNARFDVEDHSEERLLECPR